MYHKFQLAYKTSTRQWQRSDSFIFALRTLWFACSIIYLTQQDPTPDLYGLLLSWFLLSFMIPQLFFRPGRINPGFYIATELLITGSLFLYLSPMGGGIYKFLYLPLTIGYLSNKKLALFTGPASGLALPILALWFGNGGLAPGPVSDFMAYYIAFYGLGFSLNYLIQTNGRMAELINIIREKNEVLEQYSQQIEHLTLVEERSRMARELHDTVGHIFTSTIMGMDAVRYQIDVQPEEAKKNLQELLALTRTGLDDVRQSIHEMGDRDNMRLSESLQRIAGEFSRHTGTEIRFQCEGLEIDLPAAVITTMSRCLQEALTNAKKHGQSTRVAVSLRFEEELSELRIEDNGAGAENLSHGFGLHSMSERLAGLGGTLEVFSQEGLGTTVVSRIPLAGSKQARSMAGIG